MLSLHICIPQTDLVYEYRQTGGHKGGQVPATFVHAHTIRMC